MAYQWRGRRSGSALELAERTAEAVPTDNVEPHVSDADPLQAIEDALRTFPADEVIIVTRPDEEAAWLETGPGATGQTRFSLPATHLVTSDRAR